MHPHKNLYKMFIAALFRTAQSVLSVTPSIESVEKNIRQFPGGCSGQDTEQGLGNSEKNRENEAAR